jgi:hypothetical protein
LHAAQNPAYRPVRLFLFLCFSMREFCAALAALGEANASTV